MIPGKQYKPEDILEAAWRRRWFIVIPVVLISAMTVVVSLLVPDRYRSEALLLIVPQRVPEDYVRPTVTMRLDERLQAIGQQILSRTQLEQIMKEFGLYARERQRLIMEDVIEQMRQDVYIGRRAGGRSDAGAFTVAFESKDPRTAMLVTERLASLFIKANLEDRSTFADMTDQFLESQLEDARRKLKDHEAKLEDFKRQHPGRMPQEMQMNQQALANAQTQLQALQESINRDRDRQLMLERIINDANNAAAAAAQNSEGTAAAGPPSTARQLEGARVALKNMEARLKPEHPDIRSQKRLIADLEQKAAAEALQQPVTAPTSPPTPASAARAARLSELEAESDSLDRRIASKQEGEKGLLSTITGYTQRIQSVPATEAKLTELMRDYATLQTTYQNLLTKSQEARMASNLERRQIGEQFKIIDSPRIPQKPISPNRPRIILLGCFVALAFGMGLAAMLEYRDKSLRTEEDVLIALALPVLALVPTMITHEERRRTRRNRLLLASSGAAVFVCSAVVFAWKFRAIADWVR